MLLALHEKFPVGNLTSGGHSRNAFCPSLQNDHEGSPDLPGSITHTSCGQHSAPEGVSFEQKWSNPHLCQFVSYHGARTPPWWLPSLTVPQRRGLRNPVGIPGRYVMPGFTPHPRPPSTRNHKATDIPKCRLQLLPSRYITSTFRRLPFHIWTLSTF